MDTCGRLSSKRKTKVCFFTFFLSVRGIINALFTTNQKKDGTGWLKTNDDAYAMKITSTSKVGATWKGMVDTLIGSKPVMMIATTGDGVAGECPETMQPKELSNWVLEEVHKIALEFSKGPIEVLYKEVSDAVLEMLKDIIKNAGRDAKKWAKHQGPNIMLKSLIPIYGIYQAIKRLHSLKSDAIYKFHSTAQLNLANYKNECLNEAEQARRKYHLIEETNKVIASKKWKDRIKAFEGTISSKLPSIVDPS